MAAGVGTAVFIGLGAAVAAADDGADGSRAASNSTQTDAGPAKKRAERPSTRNDRSDDSSSQNDSASTESESESEPDDRDVELDDRGTDGTVDEPDTDTDTDTDAAEPDTDEAVVDEPADHDVVPVVDVNATQPSPVADETPPAAGQQLWTLLGAARREVDNDIAAHPSADVVTAEVSDAAPAESITYTAEPTFFDQVVVFSLRVMRGISRFTGVDVNGLLAKALESARPPWFVKHGLDVRSTEYQVSDGNTWQVWEFQPPNPTGKTVIAVHGGGFVVQPLVTHWSDYAAMARTTGATVVVPMYPLATTEAGSATRVVPAMAQFISHHIAARGAEDVSVYADSAGTILAMSAVRELVLSGRPVPASMVLLSPAPDASLSNPAIRDIDDPVIDVDNLDFYTDGSHWADGFEPTDPMVSPLFIEDAVLAGFPPTTIYIGTLEIGLPDTLLLHEKWNAAGGTASLVVGTGQIHDWALGGSINSQASKVRPEIYRQLGLNGVADGPATITTAPPSFGDQLIIGTLRTLRWFSTVTGIKLFTPIVGAATSADPPPETTTGLIVTERSYNGWPVWELASPQPSGEYVVALHGGGFESEANIIHWSDYASMSRDTGATVLVPIYPLAPPKSTGTASTLVPPMADYLSMLIAEHGVDNVSLYGDSAGGSYAMLAVQEMLRRCRSDVQCVVSESQPSRMVLVSPALHLTLSGPEVDAIDDPILPSRPAGEGPQFNGEWDMDDPRVNPISSADLTGLPPTTVYIGTLEKLYPGALAFRDKLLAQDPDADFTVIIGDGQMHGWALGGIYINSQAPVWRSTVYRQLGLLPEENPARITRVQVV
ncbi:Triacylglycerol lipase [Mycolicibacterium vanbaalenii]|uniref:Triacylglycerol lipase n=1 Tax=Mycolicibacterium vanbaalenii TaxID=110539 RepID=A0A5S9R516_MYCVN|nr:alpha/beta hydrolase [Mycolicibacterium vanbaalenii]CAA0128343.1 Triacylglycerol lipase [Mycolicibacterium vanbaalenii]